MYHTMSCRLRGWVPTAETGSVWNESIVASRLEIVSNAGFAEAAMSDRSVAYHILQQQHN